MEIVVNSDEYLYYKFINTLVYTDNYDEVFSEFLDRFQRPRLITLIMFNTIVTDLKSIIDEDMERNILNFTNYLKEQSKSDDFCIDYPNISVDKCYELCNEIISHVNNNKIKGNDLISYCLNQLALRGYGFIDRVILTSPYNLLSTFKHIKDWHVQDFEVLLLLYSDKIGDEYEKRKDKYCDPNSLYITCIKILVQENPELLENDSFLIRAKYILDKYKKNVDAGNYSKQIKRKMLIRNHQALEYELLKKYY